MNLALKQAMRECGHTNESLAGVVGVDPKTVSRWLTGARTPHPRHRATVSETLRRDIFDLWPDQRLQPAWLRPWIEIERESTTLRSFQLAVIPGLLQTEAYARAVLSAGRPGPDQIEQLVAGRMERQRILNGRRSPYCTFVVDEIALRRGTPEVMHGQLQKLLDPGENASLHVVPLRPAFYAGQAGSFTLATVNGRTLGVMEDPAEGRVTEDVELLTRNWESVRSVALPADQTRDLIAKMVGEL
ncbi:MAG TPA: Scr1 family TA system antitoxin-like transcriptional regulator [Micromonospora sp.]